MFEYMVENNKIVVFCSMINKIKYRYGEHTDWKHKERFEKHGFEANPMELEKCLRWDKHQDKIALKYKNENDEVEDEYDLDVIDERELVDCFKLKQQFLVKIV